MSMRTVTETEYPHAAPVPTASNAYVLEMARRHVASSRDFYGREDALFEMIEELPADEQITTLIALLRSSTLRSMAVDLLKYNVAAARDHNLYPYMFVERLSSWLATAQEVIASKGKVRRVLRYRDEPRPR